MKHPRWADLAKNLDHSGQSKQHHIKNFCFMSDKSNNKEKLQSLIDKLAHNSDVGVISPQTKARLEKEGINFPESQKQTFEEYFTNLKNQSLEIAQKLPDPPAITLPAVLSLYYEIRKAIIFGLNGAAITLSGILVEYMLKIASYKIEMGGFALYDAEKWDEFENLDFSAAVGRAKKNGLISSAHSKQLNRFRENCRNPYNHYNIKKITSVYEGWVETINLKTNQLETLYIKAVDDPVIQAQIKPLADAERVIGIFEFADALVKVLWEKIEPLQKKSSSNKT